MPFELQRIGSIELTVDQTVKNECSIRSVVVVWKSSPLSLLNGSTSAR